jgi:sulfur-carrier protein adenylyltransferase/sulfurtransferase
MSTPHRRDPRLSPQHAIKVTLVGVGGTGSRMLYNLANLDSALRALGWRGLEVMAIDPDVVSHTNMARGPFFESDIGQNKSAILVNRINVAYGLGWKAGKSLDDWLGNVVISCVDSKQSRREVQARFAAHRLIYWLDTGNDSRTGQYVLGHADKPELPLISQRYPEFLIGEDDPQSPSCSAREALEKQDFGINEAVATHATTLLWNLLRHGEINHAGGFINLAYGMVTPIALIGSSLT